MKFSTTGAMFNHGLNGLGILTIIVVGSIGFGAMSNFGLAESMTCVIPRTMSERNFPAYTSACFTGGTWHKLPADHGFEGQRFVHRYYIYPTYLCLGPILFAGIAFLICRTKAKSPFTHHSLRTALSNGCSDCLSVEEGAVQRIAMNLTAQIRSMNNAENSWRPGSTAMDFTLRVYRLAFYVMWFISIPIVLEIPIPSFWSTIFSHWMAAKTPK